MAVSKTIASLDYKELLVLCGVFLKNPLYLLPTYKATNQTVALSDRLYGKLHHKDNRTNAFRHALWNYLICKHCLSVAGSPEKAMNWSKKITDLHERLSPNEELAKVMDLHNNRIGRELFFISRQEDEEETISTLQQMTRDAVKVESLLEIDAEKEKLVFIEKLKTPL
ncbi:MAG TPA: hypothetical protein VK941_12495 [Gillisia sp.]|nr:hypothetical protein [Gillisia sp.]